MSFEPGLQPELLILCSDTSLLKLRLMDNLSLEQVMSLDLSEFTRIEQVVAKIGKNETAILTERAITFRDKFYSLASD